MRHLLLCPDYPPSAHAGGIATYAIHLCNLLVKAGETVHVVCRSPVDTHVELQQNGHLTIHRVASNGPEFAEVLSHSGYTPQAFSWNAALYIEKLVTEERIDVIESQEYEAPLFYLQLRRALGLGPKEKPPCVIHLHSPTELIARYNGWKRHHFDWHFAGRLERFSIAASDSILSPSKHLAQYVETNLNLPADSVRIIRYPAGETRFLDRDEMIWREGSICYVGRFEKRKGIDDWISAAREAANNHSGLIFEFVGHNKQKDRVLSKIPAGMRDRFLFYGERAHCDLEIFLKRARLAVVPSRWENFPYTCIEAMASGLPVIGTFHGGIPEMIEDGKTGWITRRPGSEGLRDALDRALTTTPIELASMGRSAADRIQKICGNETVLQDHLSFRTAVAQTGAHNHAELLSWHFPEFRDALDDPTEFLRRFVKQQPAATGKRAADLMRQVKRKIHLPVPARVSLGVYRFLAGKTNSGGFLQPLKATRRESLKEVPTTDLLHELTARLEAVDASCFSSEENLALGKLLQDRLNDLLDVHNNRFSHQRLRDYYQTYIRPLASLRPPVEQATWIELGCGSQNPFAFLFLLLILGAKKGIGVDPDPIQNLALAAKALADIASVMLTDPDSIVTEKTNREQILRRIKSFDLHKLRAGDLSGVDHSRLDYLCQSTESLTLADGVADVVMSNSFLEHVADMGAVVRQMFRITKPGGVGLHGVDWSDHRRYSDSQINPLAFLCLQEQTNIVAGCNRMRLHEMVAVFEQNGFEVLEQEVWFETPLTDEEIQKFAEPFRSMQKTQLQPLNGMLYVRRKL